ncbi:hypothetical protein Pelo_15617 [Pelomyxa schiedti]|nr:hypothetical protein Pelo_15617 [Pelomyxa schiedti]
MATSCIDGNSNDNCWCVIASILRARNQMGALVPAVGHIVGRLLWKMMKMAFEVGRDTLRAREQLGALASASTTASCRRFVAVAGSGDDVTMTATATTALVTWGHVLARLVWDMVVSTARVFVFLVDETSQGGHYDERCLCVRVSPLLLSVVGEIQDRALVHSWLWVDDTRYLGSGDGGHDVTPPVQRWIMCSAGDPASEWRKMRDDGVAVCEEPVWFRPHSEAVNSKWFVLLGRGVGSEKVLLVHRFNNDCNRQSGFSHHKVPLDVIAECDTLRFERQRPDELLLFLLKKARSEESSIVAIVIDVEQTHSNGALCVLSTTSWASPFVGGLTSSFVLRKKSGARCFICSAYIDDPNAERVFLGFAVEETTGCVTPLASDTWLDPVNDSMFLITDRHSATYSKLSTCDCNDPTNPSKVVVTSDCLDHQTGNISSEFNQRRALGVRSGSGFLLCTAGSHLRVIEPFTGFCVLTLVFPLCSTLHTTLQFCS